MYYSFEYIKKRSASEQKLIVGYTDAMELLDICKNDSTQVIGWEGWLNYDDGRLLRSKKYQGSCEHSPMPSLSVIALTRSILMQAHTEWYEKPEVENADLLFCIITNT